MRHVCYALNMFMCACTTFTERISLYAFKVGEKCNFTSLVDWAVGKVFSVSSVFTSTYIKKLLPRRNLVKSVKTRNLH